MDRLQQLNLMLKEDPNDSFLLFAIAKENEKIGEMNTAIECYENLVLKDPEYVGTYYHLAFLYAEKEEINQALETYEKGIQIAKKLSDFHALSELINAKKNLEMESL